jgi:hypothetical protein
MLSPHGVGGRVTPAELSPGLRSGVVQVGSQSLHRLAREECREADRTLQRFQRQHHQSCEPVGKPEEVPPATGVPAPEAEEAADCGRLPREDVPGVGWWNPRENPRRRLGRQSRAEAAPLRSRDGPDSRPEPRRFREGGPFRSASPSPFGFPLNSPVPSDADEALTSEPEPLSQEPWWVDDDGVTVRDENSLILAVAAGPEDAEFIARAPRCSTPFGAPSSASNTRRRHPRTGHRVTAGSRVFAKRRAATKNTTLPFPSRVRCVLEPTARLGVADLQPGVIDHAPGH